MSARYEHIKKFQERLWAKDSPVVINKSALLHDKIKDVNILQLEIENISDDAISALELSIECKNISGETVEIKEFTYLDLNISKNSIFGVQTAIQLNNKESRNFLYVVKKVYFNNGNIVDLFFKMDSIEIPRLINNYYGELTDIFITEINKKNICSEKIFKPIFTEDYWYCACGKINNIRRNICRNCNISKVDLIQISDIKYLQEKQVNYKKEQNQLKLERIQKIKRRTIIIASFVAVISCILGSILYLKEKETIKNIDDAINKKEYSIAFEYAENLNEKNRTININKIAYEVGKNIEDMVENRELVEAEKFIILYKEYIDIETYNNLIRAEYLLIEKEKAIEEEKEREARYLSKTKNISVSDISLVFNSKDNKNIFILADSKQYEISCIIEDEFVIGCKMEKWRYHDGKWILYIQVRPKNTGTTSITLCLKEDEQEQITIPVTVNLE